VTLEGVVIDNRDAKLTGKWTAGTGLRGYVGYEYVYAPANSDATIRYDWAAAEAGRIEIRLSYGTHANRGTTVPVEVEIAGKKHSVTVNMREPPPLPGGFTSLGQFDVRRGDAVTITLSAVGAHGNVHADAVQIVTAKSKSP
jgi:hypothetical protein